MGAKIEKAEKDVAEIVVKYDDGTEETIKKGFAGTLEDLDDEVGLKMEFANISGNDLHNIMHALLMFATQVLPNNEEE